MSPEAPVPVFRETGQETKLGMSDNVRLNLESFGIEVTHHCNIKKIKKHRFIEEKYNQQLFRYDQGENEILESMPPAVLGKFDAVVVSDYDKGYITPASFNILRKQIGQTTPIFVDSKKQDLTCFKNCIIKINELEDSKAKVDPTQEIIVTLGASGARWKNNIYKTEKVDVFDVCGAGDVFLAGLVYGYLHSRNMPIAIELANRCASLSVTKMGTYVLSEQDIKTIGV
tara:strand:- start:15 stop:698 length:684 start_codon:yes stop_codon:yes gene_type:complete